MKSIYRKVENVFEKVANVGNQLFSNSIVFILAIILVIYWMAQRDWRNTSMTDGLIPIIISILSKN